MGRTDGEISPEFGLTAGIKYGFRIYNVYPRLENLLNCLDTKLTPIPSKKTDKLS